jgi:hypothetical protein
MHKYLWHTAVATKYGGDQMTTNQGRPPMRSKLRREGQDERMDSVYEVKP